jgi:hypothetical protein
MGPGSTNLTHVPTKTIIPVPVNYPVLEADRSVAYIIHRVEDVTEFVRLKQQGTIQGKIAEEFLTRAHQRESEVFARAQELQKTNTRLRTAKSDPASRSSDPSRQSCAVRYLRHRGVFAPGPRST